MIEIAGWQGYDVLETKGIVNDVVIHRTIFKTTQKKQNEIDL